MNHANTHRLRKASCRSPLREANPGKGNLVIEEVNEAYYSPSYKLRPEKKKGSAADVSDSVAYRSATKSTTPDGRSKIFIRTRTKNNEEIADIATTAVSASATDIVTSTAAVQMTDDSACPAIDVDGERISDGGGQEADEFGPKTWNLRPRKTPPTKKRSIGHSGGILKSFSGSLPDNKPLGTVRTESIRSRNGVEAKHATTERKEKKPKLSISLSKMEIDEDIYALTGSKPSRRPKKRAKNVQKQLDVLFPGLWMGNVSSEAYKKNPSHLVESALTETRKGRRRSLFHRFSDAEMPHDASSSSFYNFSSETALVRLVNTVLRFQALLTISSSDLVRSPYEMCEPDRF